MHIRRPAGEIPLHLTHPIAVEALSRLRDVDDAVGVAELVFALSVPIGRDLGDHLADLVLGHDDRLCHLGGRPCP